ncbi:AAA family ATPase [Fibrella sp. ES10-3-2-2]|nr:chromosome segregation protein SMC [Fibrella sp. ES10-3-2-2]
MQIKRLVIENFKSIERIELIEPNPFTVFVGPNGSGKSNIFEALEFITRAFQTSSFEAVRLHGGPDKLRNRRVEESEDLLIRYEFEPSLDYTSAELSIEFEGNKWSSSSKGLSGKRADELGIGTADRGEASVFFEDYSTQFFNRHRRIFIKNTSLLRTSYQDDVALNFAATNLEPVLKRLLTNDLLREEIFEWLDLFVPGFKAVEVDDRDELHWFEEGNDRYFTKDLISDGTYSILALLTAIYQSDEPQFLCIEEPENGLHPQVQMTLVEFFRKVCQEKSHYIWLNTHSEAIVRKLTTDEIVLVDKVDGITKTKQTKGKNIYDLPTDEAWLTGMLGGGLPW